MKEKMFKKGIVKRLFAFVLTLAMVFTLMLSMNYEVYAAGYETLLGIFFYPNDEHDTTPSNDNLTKYNMYIYYEEDTTSSDVANKIDTDGISICSYVGNPAEWDSHYRQYTSWNEDDETESIISLSTKVTDENCYNFYLVVCFLDGNESCYCVLKSNGTNESTDTLYFDNEDVEPGSDGYTGWIDGTLKGTGEDTGTDNTQPVAVHRYLRPDQEDWLMTCNEEEIAILEAAGWEDEGVLGFAGTEDAGVPVIRFHNRLTGDRMYTSNEKEIQNYRDAEVYGWDYEGIAFYTGKNVEVVRFRTPFGSHIWSTSKEEINNLDIHFYDGWKKEGVAFYL